MTLDIQEGDLLVVGSTSYHIRFAQDFSEWGTSPTFKRNATIAASTRRTPAISGGKRGDPVTNLTGLYVTPLDAASNDILQRVITKTPYKLRECYIADATSFMRLAVEELQL